MIRGFHAPRVGVRTAGERRSESLAHGRRLLGYGVLTAFWRPSTTRSAFRAVIAIRGRRANIGAFDLPLASFPFQELRFGFRLTASRPPDGGSVQIAAQQFSRGCAFQFLEGAIATLAKQTTGGGDFCSIREYTPTGWCVI